MMGDDGGGKMEREEQAATTTTTTATTKTDPKKRKKKTWEAKWERKLRDAHISPGYWLHFFKRYSYIYIQNFLI